MDGDRPEEPHVSPDPRPTRPYLTEPERAVRAIVVGVVLGAVLAALARRS
jgi:hypothetical protein